MDKSAAIKILRVIQNDYLCNLDDKSDNSKEAEKENKDAVEALDMAIKELSK